MTQSERFRRTACAAIGLYRIPLEFLLLTRFSLGVILSRTSLDAFISRVVREHDFTTSRKVRSLFLAVPMPHIFPLSPLLPCHLIIVMKLAGYFLKRRVFLFHLLNVCGTRVSTASLSQIIAAGIFFDLTRPTRPDLIFRDILTVYIMIHVRAYNCPVTLGRLEVETCAPLKLIRSVADGALAGFRKYIRKRENSSRFFFISSFSPLNSKVHPEIQWQLA